jgi:hypothetical protein
MKENNIFKRIENWIIHPTPEQALKRYYFFDGLVSDETLNKIAPGTFDINREKVPYTFFPRKKVDQVEQEGISKGKVVEELTDDGKENKKILEGAGIYGVFQDLINRNVVKSANQPARIDDSLINEGKISLVFDEYDFCGSHRGKNVIAKVTGSEIKIGCSSVESFWGIGSKFETVEDRNEVPQLITQKVSEAHIVSY